ncbi:MAG: TPM domain-containing protein [Bacteroidota bacterium]|nr:TPM domain-containing protein [Bacteroidota bacterium]MDP4213434.1 TPM domain-containing protein [Bacteroidota bacterium]MDP4251113.1 TPM domain-containing protein [Bacteroidota bacterium]
MKIPFFSKKDFFSPAEKNHIVAAIREAEQQTSGEVRVFVESRCRFVDPLDRAAEVFWLLKMEQTEARNAVLVYVAVKDRQLALFGDRGIHEKVGNEFWNSKVAEIISQFRREGISDAIVKMIGDIGAALKYHFPYNGETDVNELPDDIIFGR